MLNTIIITTLVAGRVTAFTDIEHQRFMLKNMDPIVMPGEYKSHMHSFYGSDAVTTYLPNSAELQKGCPSGENPNDLSVYEFKRLEKSQLISLGIPTLYYVNGSNFIEVNPASFKTYYENIGSAQIPFPADFFAVAGDPGARSQSDIDENVTGITWWCENGPEDRTKRPRAAMPQVTCSTHIQAILRFPDCVDPSNIKNHTYSALNGRRCPSNMKRMPQLRFSVRYDVRRIIPQGWSGVPPLKLACGEIGDGYCFHGDFVNGWFDDAAKYMLNATSGSTFLRIDGAHGNGKQKSPCTPKDSAPQNGTSNYLTSLQMQQS